MAAGRMAILAAVLAAGAAPARAVGPDELTEDERIVHVLNRLTPGATAELLSRVRREGLDAWLDRQLAGGLEEPEAFRSRVARRETLGMSSAEISQKYFQKVPKDATPAQKREAMHRAGIPVQDTLAWIVLRAVYSAHGVREAGADFFRNHFSVSIDKKLVKFFAVDWEREVIFKRSLGNFGDLLEATARHPAMLYYLDNFLSRRPPTAAELALLEARRKRNGEEPAQESLDVARQRGLNENYAREIMELHTLGVDNVYTQEDVLSLARCLTGWTFTRRGDAPPEFLFSPRLHCPGDKTFLGSVIPENRTRPVAEGEEAILRLKEHEGTARFLAWKLCRWFVHDQPDDALVGRMAAVFRETKGDLPSVLRALVHDPAFFRRENYRAKVKRPWEFIISALRATDAEVGRVEPLLKALTSMNEPLYRCSAPTGYYDQAEAWCDPGSMAARWTFAEDLAQGKIGGIRIPSALYADLDPAKPDTWKDALAAKILPATGLGRATSESLDRIVAAERAKDPRAGPGRVGPLLVSVILGSPEFQRQ